MYRGQIAVCKMEISLMDRHYITLFAEQLTRTFEVLFSPTSAPEAGSPPGRKAAPLIPV